MHPFFARRTSLPAALVVALAVACASSACGTKTPLILPQKPAAVPPAAAAGDDSSAKEKQA